MRSPSYRFTRSLFGVGLVDVDCWDDSDDGLLEVGGGLSEDEDMLLEDEEVESAWTAVEEDAELRAVAGTVDSARSRLSTLSTRSRANFEIAKSRAAAMSRLVRSCRLRKSAIERRYRSCNRQC